MNNRYLSLDDLVSLNFYKLKDIPMNYQFNSNTPDMIVPVNYKTTLSRNAMSLSKSCELAFYLSLSNLGENQYNGLEGCCQIALTLDEFADATAGIDIDDDEWY